MDDTTVAGVAALVIAGLIPRRTRLVAGVAGIVILSRAHGARVERLEADVGEVAADVARTRLDLEDRIEDLEELAAGAAGHARADNAWHRTRVRVQRRAEEV